MSHRLEPLAPHEYCRVQTIAAPGECSRICVFIEARDRCAVAREIDRLGHAQEVQEAVFAVPMETPRETYVSYGFLCGHLRVSEVEASLEQRRNIR